MTLYPAVGGSATATIAVTATDGRTKDTYTVTVKRVAPLSGIALSSGALSPAFHPATTAYAVNAAFGTKVRITPAAATGCSYLLNGGAEPFVEVEEPLSGDPVVVTIVAMAGNGVTTVAYTVTVDWSQEQGA